VVDKICDYLSIKGESVYTVEGRDYYGNEIPIKVCSTFERAKQCAADEFQGDDDQNSYCFKLLENCDGWKMQIFYPEDSWMLPFDTEVIIKLHEII